MCLICTRRGVEEVSRGSGVPGTTALAVFSGLAAAEIAIARTTKRSYYASQSRIVFATAASLGLRGKRGEISCDAIGSLTSNRREMTLRACTERPLMAAIETVLSGLIAGGQKPLTEVLFGYQKAHGMASRTIKISISAAASRENCGNCRGQR